MHAAGVEGSMYQQHFDLAKALFGSPIAGDGSVFLSARLRAVVDNIEIASSTRDSALVLHGPAGLGKTTIAAHALRNAGTRLAIGWLGDAAQTGTEVLDLLLGEFGFDVHGQSRGERLQSWRQYLRELGATDTRAYIAVESAHELPVAALQALDTLTRPDPNGGPGANLVLMGPTRLCGLLDEPALQHLKQRVRLRQRFAPFEQAETEAYLVHQIMAAGGNYDAVFRPGAAGAVHAFSAGVPRIINNLCETVLAVAARRKIPAVTAELVEATAVGLCGLSPPAADAHVAHERAVDALLSDADGDTDEDAAALTLESAAREEIPTLTESVEIDIDSGAYELVVEAAASA
ncbi:MAG TPA: AAA family ATPase [Gammaproteobacteria bacterium]|nr:AAA family ATPase [Gammaproteobacteria bacterium]